MYIESSKNTQIKNIVKLLEKRKERQSQELFVVEGVQENSYALSNNFKAVDFYIQEDIYTNAIDIPSSANITYVSQEAYDKIAYRNTTEGIIGIYQYPFAPLNHLKLTDHSSILLLESVEKPGNLGAICRSADALGIDAIIICEEKVDFYNPNTIRSSVGSVFSVPTFSTSKEEAYQFLQTHNIALYTTYMSDDAKSIHEVDFTKKSAILFGAEHSGVSSFWLEKERQNILIPMVGQIDSLNVSNAVAITSYEILRQKKP